MIFPPKLRHEGENTSSLALHNNLSAAPQRWPRPASFFSLNSILQKYLSIIHRGELRPHGRILGKKKRPLFLARNGRMIGSINN